MASPVGAVAILALVGCASSAPDGEPPVPPPLELASEPTETAVDRAFLRGLVALKLQDYERARREVGRVAVACADEEIGGRALLALAAAELDPRNGEGDPSLARLLMERFLRMVEKPAWTEPVAEALYLLALDRGGGLPPERAAPEAAEPEQNGERAARTPEDGQVYVPAQGARPSAGGTQGEEDALLHEFLLVDAPEGGFTPAECAQATGALRGGPLEAPILPEAPIVDRMLELVTARDSLRATVEAKDRELTNLRQELERIRETLRP